MLKAAFPASNPQRQLWPSAAWTAGEVVTIPAAGVRYQLLPDTLPLVIPLTQPKKHGTRLVDLTGVASGGVEVGDHNAATHLGGRSSSSSSSSSSLFLERRGNCGLEDHHHHHHHHHHHQQQERLLAERGVSGIVPRRSLMVTPAFEDPAGEVVTSTSWWKARGVFLYVVYLCVLLGVVVYTETAKMVMVPITIFLIVLSLVLFVFILFCVCFVIFL